MSEHTPTPWQPTSEVWIHSLNRGGPAVHLDAENYERARLCVNGLDGMGEPDKWPAAIHGLLLELLREVRALHLPTCHAKVGKCDTCLKIGLVESFLAQYKHPQPTEPPK